MFRCQDCRGNGKQCQKCLERTAAYNREYYAGQRRRLLLRGAAGLRTKLIEQFTRIGRAEMTGYTAAEIVREISSER